MEEVEPLRRHVEKILADSKRAVHPREIAARLEIPPEQYADLLHLIDDLRQEGLLKLLPGGRVRAVEANEGGAARKAVESWAGVLSVNPRGFGFVNAAGREDVFIAPGSIYEALHGDTVRVQVVGRTDRGTEGRVEAVVSRRNPRLSGLIHKQRKGSWVEPDDTRIRGPMQLLGDLSGVKDGDSAIVEISRFPEFADELPEVRLVEVLGPPGTLETEVRKILLSANVKEQHEPETLANAEHMASILRLVKRDGRRDLRSVPLPTIDPEDARDHDDAIWVERSGNGYRVFVAIADVSEYVREDSPLDAEAHERGCTIYLPDRAVPMLPRALAGDLCSLLPEVDRYCLCVIAELDAKACVKKFEIVEGVMRSSARLTYGGVARALGLDPESPQSPAAEAMKEDLFVLKEVAERLRRARMAQGALDLDLPEARVVVDDETGAPIEVKKRATRPGLKVAYSLVEEMMLLANELVARWLVERDVPAIYRVHDLPDDEKLERLARVAKKLDVAVDVAELREPRGAADFLERAQEHERSRVLVMLLLRSLKQATYDISNVGHFGLASQAYVHFTSPIRRYPDLRVHRQIKKLLRGGRVDRSSEAQDDLRAAATDSSKKERAAMDVERQVLDLYRAVYMQRHIGDVFEGQVTGLSGTGLYVSLEDPFCDVLVPFEALGLERFEPDEDEIGVRASRSGETIMLGDTITLEISDVAVGRRLVLGKRISSTPGDELAGMEPWLGPTRDIPGRRARPAGRSGGRAPAPRKAGETARGESRDPGAASRSGVKRPASGRGAGRAFATTDSEQKTFKPRTSAGGSGKAGANKTARSSKTTASGKASTSSKASARRGGTTSSRSSRKTSTKRR